MPNTSKTYHDGYAHCPDARCEGYAQQPVRVRRDLSEYTFKENGGDIPGIERSMVYLHPVTVDDEDRDLEIPGDHICSACEKPLQASLDLRPSYQNISGYAQDGLLTARAG